MSALKGHPKGLYLIFATSTAERFSYYSLTNMVMRSKQMYSDLML